MRLRYKYVTYHFGEDQSSQQSLERHYRQLMDELLRQGQHHTLPQRAVQWRPPADIQETPDTIVVKMELAGMRDEDIEVTLYEDALVVTGRREDDSDHDNTVYYHEAQIRYGPFRAEVLLPGPVRRDAVEARYENGFLRVVLPKVTERESDETRITIKRNNRSSGASQPLQASGGEAAQPAAQPGVAPAEVLAVVPAHEVLPGSISRGGLHDA
jgi:HSP20 family protein